MRCANPSSRFCECHACGNEKRAIDQARNRVCYDKQKNPLVEWTLSDEWTQPPAMVFMRGMTEVAGTHVAHVQDTAGEIPWRKFDGLSRTMVSVW